MVRDIGRRGGVDGRKFGVRTNCRERLNCTVLLLCVHQNGTLQQEVAQVDDQNKPEVAVVCTRRGLVLYP